MPLRVIFCYFVYTIYTSVNTLTLRFLECVDAVIQKENFRSERSFLLANGWNPTTLYKIRNNLLQVAPSFIQHISLRYGINSNYIFTGKGSIFEKTKADGSQSSDGDDVIEVPYLSVAATATFAEHFIDQPDPALTQQKLAILKPKLSNLKNLLVMEVSGESMEPQLRNGSRVLIQQMACDDWAYLQSGVYAVVFRNSWVVKRIKDNELLSKQILTLHSDNTSHGSFPVKGEDIRAIFKVLEIVSSPVY